MSTHFCLALRRLLTFCLTLVNRVSSVFIFQTFAEVCYSVFVKRSSFKSLLKSNNLSKILLWIEPSYFSAWFVTVFGKCVRRLVHYASNRVDLTRRPLCHNVNLQSCVARRLLCHKVNPPSCVLGGRCATKYIYRVV